MKFPKLAAAFAALALAAGPGAAAETKVLWHGHAAFEIVTPKGKTLFIDPWLSNPMNPDAQGGKNPLAAVTAADYILLTHGHFDHVGDAVALAKKTGARLVANFELGTALAGYAGFPKEQMGFDTLMNIGGEIQIADGEVTVAMTPAAHSSGLSTGSGTVYGGSAAGFVLKIKDGPVIYDSGDTAYFGDMSLIGEADPPDLALINIGGHFGMEPAAAVRAAKAVRAKFVVPQHFRTFPVLTQEARGFFDELNKAGIDHAQLDPGGWISFEGHEFTGINGKKMKTFQEAK